jgi:hypothetical protein
MQAVRLFSTRLELVSATVELAQAAMSDLSASAGQLSVPLPAIRPPPLNDGYSQRKFMASLQKAKTSDAG